jgi:spindle assembly abnormal protein 6
MGDLQRENPLFDALVAMNVQHNGIDNDHTLLLTLRILMGSRLAGNSNQEKFLHFEVTDDNNPFFLYILDISDQEFHILKRDQAIIVDFSSFSSKFIELVALCQGSSTAKGGNSIGASRDLIGSEDGINSVVDVAHISPAVGCDGLSPPSSSDFYLRLDIESGVLSIVESNCFKQITHISLRLRSGNDSCIKAYLASRLSHSLKILRRNQAELSNVTDKLAAEHLMRQAMSEELSELRKNRDLDLHSAQISHTTEVSAQQVAATELLEKTRREHESYTTDMRTRFENQLRNTEATIRDIEGRLLHEQHERQAAGFKVRELTKDNEALVLARDRLSSENEDSIVIRWQIEAEKQRLEKSLVRSETTKAGLETQLQSLQHQLQQRQQLLISSEETKHHLEAQLKLYTSSYDALQDKLRGAVEEIQRGNSVISELQSRLIHFKDKVANKNEVIRRQETILRERADASTTIQAHLKNERDAHAATRLEMEQHQLKLQVTKQHVKESASVIESNQEVISWLNQELSRYQLAGPLFGGERSPSASIFMGLSKRKSGIRPWTQEQQFTGQNAISPFPSPSTDVAMEDDDLINRENENNEKITITPGSGSTVQTLTTKESSLAFPLGPDRVFPSAATTAMDLKLFYKQSLSTGEAHGDGKGIPTAADYIASYQFLKVR